MRPRGPWLVLTSEATVSDRERSSIPLEKPVSLVSGLVLLHLSATALLLVVLLTVMACQRAADLVRQHRLARRPVAVAYPQVAGASVLDWTIDLRTPATADSGAVLQRTS